MISKLFGKWLFGMSFCSFGALTLGEYLRNNDCGIKFKDHVNKFSNIPSNKESLEEACKTYSKKHNYSIELSPSEYAPILLKSESEKIAKKLNFLNFVFPYSNPDLKKFEKVYEIPIKENIGSNICNILIMLPFYPFLKRGSLAFGNPYFQVLAFMGIFIVAFVKNSEVIAINQLDSMIQNKDIISVDSEFFYKGPLYALFSISLYNGIKINHTLPEVLIQNLNRLEILNSFQSKYFFLLLLFFGNEALRSIVKTSKKSFNNIENENIDLSFVKKCYWLGLIINFIFLANLSENYQKDTRALLIFQNARALFLRYILKFVSEMHSNYKEKNKTVDTFFDFFYLGGLIYGLAAISILKLKLPK